MGQGQSSHNASQAEAPAKADYYDLLDVERTATDDEIKKAYRRKALELHPDRNYGNVEETTRLFAEIQSAYEVLSDTQERAWYDSHRDVLLRGDQPGAAGEEFSYNVRMTTADGVLQLMLKFNGKLDHSDSPSGFFGGLHDFFQTLAKEEDIACQWEDSDQVDYPEFGHKDDDYEDVVKPFYAVWNGFATRKSYSWKDQYRLSDAPDRRIRRLMEKENKKLREEAIQEYNDAVRSLVAFVRKRDPRVQTNQKSEAERQKSLRDAAAAQAARSRAERQAKLQADASASAIPDWAQSRTRDEHEGGFSSESDVEDHEYDCVVCDKTFKSEAQFMAHEKSKKHIKLLTQLKKEMRAEGKELDLEPQSHAQSPSTDEDRPSNHVQERGSATARDEGTEDEDDIADTAPTVSKKTPDPPGHSSEDAKDSDDSTEDDYAPRSEVESRLVGEEVETITERLQTTELEDTPATSDMDSATQTKLGKAKQKRAKKAAQKAAQGNSATAGAASSDFKCAVCQGDFASKTKLFNHIKEKGHAAPVPQVNTGTKGGKAKKR